MCEYLRKIAVCVLILQKWHQNHSAGIFYLFLKVMFSYSSFLGKLGEIRAKMVLEVL